VKVSVYEDTETPVKPDAIFPNNWLASMPDKSLYTFPMEAKNRRIERREDILQSLADRGYTIRRELESFEEENLFLEGTGSMVLDHNDRMIFAAFSSRTSATVLERFAKIVGYEIFAFETITDVPIYHTNVLMSISPDFAVICKAVIVPQYLPELEVLLSKKTVLEISKEQMHHSFLANCLMVENQEGNKLLILSESASDSLSQSQRKAIRDHGLQILSLPIPTIEKVGGGSARCMLAELF